MVSMSNGIYKKDYIYTESLGDPGLGGVQAYRVESGQPIGNMYGYRYAGLDADGKWLVYDHKGNMISALKANLDSDRYIIGNGLPKMYMGFTNTFRYKNIDFSFMLRGAYLFDIINTQRLFFENVTLVPHTNILRSAMKSQLYDNPVFSSYYIEKGDYTKLDNVTLGYNFKSNKYFKNARVYVSGANLLTFTKYKGIDPEISINGLAPGIDRRTAYPRTRTFTIGLNVTL